MRRRSRIVAASLLLGLMVPLHATAARSRPDPDTEALQLSTELRLRVLRGREIELEVMAVAGDGYRSIARRVAGDAARAEAIADWNGDRALAKGDWVRVPLALLSAGYRSLVLGHLFPEDRLEQGDWIHVAHSGTLATYDEGLWQVAEWFAGDGTRFEELMRWNGLSSPELRRGQTVRIPAALLHPALAARLVSDDGKLRFGSDARGPYAGYRLKAGEALYSSVVNRFTGRSGAADVRAVAELLRERSDIRDLRDIPVGYEIKIPLDLLEPEFLPKGHPRRNEAEAAMAAMARELERKPVAGTKGGLEGALVIIDPGHGGRDLGTMNNGIWEHDYVYDIACRLKQQLERETAATVVMTLEDRKTGCTPSKTDKLSANREGTVLTDPPFLARKEGEAKIAVNLRWYLANSVYRQATKNGTDPDRIVFLSLHADSRHPSLRGVMVYVPGAGYRAGTYGFSSRTYQKYREVREKTKNSFSKKSRVRSEAVSRQLADSIVGAYRSLGLPVQTHQPVRSRIIRGKQRYLPAVLRGNAVPNKVLVEMVNLSNPDDAALLAAAKERERLARGLFSALFDYFGEKPPTRAARR